MAEVLFVTADCGGNVPPAVGIATELRRRGHGVRFLGHDLPVTSLDVVQAGRARAIRPQDGVSALGWWAAFRDRGLPRDLLETVGAAPADLVVVDCLLLSVLHAAHRAGFPFAVLEHFPDQYYRQLLRGPLGLAARVEGLAPGRALAGARARLVTTVPELDGGGGPGLTYVGPVVDVGPVAPDRWAEPVVLVSLSTVGYGGMREVLDRVADAAAGLGARVVVTTGPAVDPASLRVPAEVEVHRFVPHAELMPHAALVVGHGGHGTTAQALAHDLPVLVLPMDRLTDQPLIGRAVQDAGAGRVLPKGTPSERLRPVIAELLSDGPHRPAAARLGAAVRARPGAVLGADAVEALLSRRAG